jgi:uncharacterized protein (DUF1684 family)
MTRLRFFLLLLGGLFLAPSLAYRTPQAGVPAEMSVEDYRASVASWRAERRERLLSETGWLTITGLNWLDPGDNPFGTDSTNTVVLPAGTAPPRAGVIRMNEREGQVLVTVHPDSGVDVRLDGEPVGTRPLATDASGEPDVLRLGRLSFWVIERGGGYAIRIRDPESPLRAGFTGIDAYPVDPEYRVTGTLEGDGTVREMAIPNFLGYTSTGFTPGPVAFSLLGTACTLLPIVDGPTDSTLFFVFEDETSGTETYGGGRFLYAGLDPEGRVVLDFNKAYNPPCAFNPHTTCPLPPVGNRLPLPVRAGEMDYAH